MPGLQLLPFLSYYEKTNREWGKINSHPDYGYNSLDLHIALVDHIQKTKKESKNLKKQGIHDIFIKTNHIKLVFKMTWLMEILKI